MRKELDEKIVSDFPLLFSDRHGDMRSTCMCWGFSCGDGWYGIIYDAASKLEPLIAAYKKQYPDEEYPRASQVKEKFGTLSFYMTHTTDEMYKVIEEAEVKSAKTCEECGDYGKLRGSGWLVTLCDSCHKERKDGDDD